jgi:hypothetical protein
MSTLTVTATSVAATLFAALPCDAGYQYTPSHTYSHNTYVHNANMQNRNANNINVQNRLNNIRNNHRR